VVSLDDGKRTAALLYLDLMKKVLTRYIFIDEEPVPLRVDPTTPWKKIALRPIQAVLWKRGYVVARYRPRPSIEDREVGRDWPPTAETMIGLKRLDSLQFCIERVLADDVPGDLIETGVWRGGATIFMRAVLAAFGVADRTIWVADSFQGVPSPRPEKYPADEGWHFSRLSELGVDIETVRANFRRYGLLDDQVQFLPGWFEDTLPKAPIQQLAVLRLDGDLYESTWHALSALYGKVSLGGYVIVDDYGVITACRQAVDDFRASESIEASLTWIDESGVFWRKTE
jgi:O-methyltransferase